MLKECPKGCVHNHGYTVLSSNDQFQTMTSAKSGEYVINPARTMLAITTVHVLKATLWLMATHADLQVVSTCET